MFCVFGVLFPSHDLDVDDNTDLSSKEFIDKIKFILQEVNKPFIKSIYFSSLNEVNQNPKYTKQGVFGSYYKNLQMAERQQKVIFTWSDSIFTESDSENKQGTDGEAINTHPHLSSSDSFSDERKRLIHFWGNGFKDDEYEWLDDEYNDFLMKYDVDSKTMEDIIKELCLTKWDIRKAREMDKPVDKLEKTFTDLMGAAKLKPVQDTGANFVAPPIVTGKQHHIS